MATSNPASSRSPIFTVNPYEDHLGLTQIEAEVLWEYAKLNQHIKDVSTPSPSDLTACHETKTCSPSQLVIQTRSLSETPDETMLKRLRILERKMGLVLTLVRYSRILLRLFDNHARHAVQSIRVGCGERANHFGAAGGQQRR
jgi:DASH complex subunit DAD3